MILCNENCIPCCDFCIHVIHEEIDITPDGSNIIYGGPIDCNLFKDEKHKEIAQCCGYCDFYQCHRANKEIGLWIEISS